MKGYNFTEIGMLTGAAVGGCLAVTGFKIWNIKAAYLLALTSIALGILTGNIIDRRFTKS